VRHLAFFSGHVDIVFHILVIFHQEKYGTPGVKTTNNLGIASLM
jgi:hypothetical protein